MSLGWQKHFGFGEENIVQGLCIYAEAVKQLIIHTKCRKNFDGSMLHAKQILERGSLEGMSPSPRKIFRI